MAILNIKQQLTIKNFDVYLSKSRIICAIIILLSLCTMGSAEKLISLEFEVFGRVQGVFFRKFTQKEALKLDLRGWCMNTTNNTVKGYLEGPIDKIAKMKTWLQKTGSPQSRIDKAVFTNEQGIATYTCDTFSIKR
ncbi:acylphosphatase-1-like [Anthonomus grandis grandis]|uniref:acylphosphatase-1-like n=1 Tax=Anthonomus grandis grandis TaxID=2921223 RepID=UPI00216583E0|nr:acylphosphatase-1-like [Anthonomus grandis grandis]